MSTVSFDGASKTIIISDSGANVSISAKEIYSLWKEWLLTNAQWEPAFRTFGGDDLGGGLIAGDYYFINNNAGWKIKPEEKDHVLTITGNLFAENPALPVFISTIGNFTVAIRQGFSSLTQTQTVQSGSGLSTEQAIKLDELHKINGLAVGKPLVVNGTNRIVVNDDINQVITRQGNQVTLERN
jgi:hypothetical protein